MLFSRPENRLSAALADSLAILARWPSRPKTVLRSVSRPAMNSIVITVSSSAPVTSWTSDAELPRAASPVPTTDRTATPSATLNTVPRPP